MSGSSSYSNKLRVRSCGLLIEHEALLLVELRSPITGKWTWIPPGGGVEFGESLEEALVREFKEETGLTVQVQERLFFQEVIEPPVHAIEFYFSVKRISGELHLGKDPEMEDEQQILRDIGFFSRADIKAMESAPDFIEEDRIWVQTNS